MKVWVGCLYNNFDYKNSNEVCLYATRARAIIEMNQLVSSIMTEYGCSFIDNNWHDKHDNILEVIASIDHIEVYGTYGDLLLRCDVYEKEVRE